MATIDALVALRINRIRQPSNKKLLLLRELASQSIGIKDVYRQRGLVFEQELLIQELRVIQQNITLLEEEIIRIVSTSREGKILLSLPFMGPISVASLIATVGNIENFETAGQLKSYLGWSPVVSQTGTSLDSTSITRGGAKGTKSLLFMLVMGAITKNTEWTIIYHRLVKRKCSYDERRKRYIGTKKVLGRIAGQMIKLIYVLLKTDQEMLRGLPPGAPLPEPMLYDPALHKKHREGGYHPHQKWQLEETLPLRRGLEKN